QRCEWRVDAAQSDRSHAGQPALRRKRQSDHLEPERLRRRDLRSLAARAAAPRAVRVLSVPRRPRMHPRFFPVAFARVLLTAPAPGQTQTQAPTKKIIFLAGPKDHGRPGRHEYEKDLRALAKSLEESPNLKGIETKVFVGKAPRDLSEFQDAAAIVIESSG